MNELTQELVIQENQLLEMAPPKLRREGPPLLLTPQVIEPDGTPLCEERFEEVKAAVEQGRLTNVTITAKEMLRAMIREPETGLHIGLNDEPSISKFKQGKFGDWYSDGFIAMAIELKKKFPNIDGIDTVLWLGHRPWRHDMYECGVVVQEQNGRIESLSIQIPWLENDSSSGLADKMVLPHLVPRKKFVNSIMGVHHKIKGESPSHTRNDVRDPVDAWLGREYAYDRKTLKQAGPTVWKKKPFPPFAEQMGKMVREKISGIGNHPDQIISCYGYYVITNRVMPTYVTMFANFDIGGH